MKIFPSNLIFVNIRVKRNESIKIRFDHPLNERPIFGSGFTPEIYLILQRYEEKEEFVNRIVLDTNGRGSYEIFPMNELASHMLDEILISSKIINYWYKSDIALATDPRLQNLLVLLDLIHESINDYRIKTLIDLVFACRLKS